MSFLKFQDFVTTVWQISSDTKSAFVCRAAALRSSVMKLTWSNAPILSHLCTSPLFPVAPYLNRNLIFKHVRPVCLVLIGSNRLLSWFCFCFLVHSHHILSKICLLAACDLWWLTVFHACNKNSLWDFFFFYSLPFPSALTHVFTVWFGSYWFHGLGKKTHQGPTKSETQKVHGH